MLAATSALTGGLLALGCAGMPVEAAHAADAGFTWVKSVDYQIDSLTSPDADTIVAAGTRAVAGSTTRVAVVSARIDGTWVEQVLDGPADQVLLSSDQGVVWALVANGGQRRLWRSVGDHLVEWPMPALPAGAASVAYTRIGAQDGVVTLTGYARRAGDGAATALVSQLRGSTWTSTRPDGGAVVDLVTTKSSRLVVASGSGNFGDASSWVFDVADAGAVWYGTGNVGYDVVANAWTARSGYDFTMWGSAYDRSAPTSHRGYCKRFADGDAQECPAPTFPVAQAVQLVDGRQVVGGDDIRSRGVALVGTDGSLTPLEGQPGWRLRMAASAVGSTVWGGYANPDGPGSLIVEAHL